MEVSNARELMALGPALPVIVIQDLDTAVDLAQALVAGGVKALEITLRSNVALEAITCIRQAVPDAVVGAGTIRSPRQLEQAQAAGACFGVSPGLTAELAQAIRQSGLPFLPGVATASEAMAAAEQGFTELKLFPAQAVGGAPLLKAWQGPLPELSFCPTGGVHADNARDYLALKNVRCVGGSWLTPANAIESHDWATLTRLAREASALNQAT